LIEPERDRSGGDCGVALDGETRNRLGDGSADSKNLIMHRVR